MNLNTFIRYNIRNNHMLRHRFVSRHSTLTIHNNFSKSASIQFAAMFTTFGVIGSLITNRHITIQGQHVLSNGPMSMIKIVGDAVAFGTFSLLSAQLVLLSPSTSNRVIDAVMTRPKDVRQIYKLAGGRIGARAAIYFIVTKECLSSYAAFRDLPVELKENGNYMTPWMVFTFFSSIPLAGIVSVFPWLCGRIIGSNIIGNSHARMIQSLERNGVEPHLIGPRYTYQALKSHWIDLKFIRNPMISRFTYFLFALLALSPHAYDNNYDYEGSRNYFKGNNGDLFEWRYEWSDKDSDESGDKDDDVHGDGRSDSQSDDGKGDGSYDV